MNKLLAHQYIVNDIDNVSWNILSLIHELRIISASQLMQLLNLSISVSLSTVYKQLSELLQNNMVGTITESKNKSQRYFFLTKQGHNTIGGLYTYPRVPEYNLHHHLEVTNYLIKSLEKVNNLPSFQVASSERRQMYEKKDMSNNKKGTLFHVADYILQFKTSEGKTEWHFEIELTLKSKRRYMNGVFPKYIKLLNHNKRTQLIYVSPSPLIKRELDTFKNYFKMEQKKGKYEKIDENVFERLHIVSSENFETELDVLIQTKLN